MPLAQHAAHERKGVYREIKREREMVSEIKREREVVNEQASDGRK